MRLILLLALLVPGLAVADDDHGGAGTLSSSTETVANLAGGDHSTIALSQGSLGDVDIYGCLGSSQFSVFIFFAKQKLEIDPLCVADGYDKAGKYNLAAQLRCQVPLVAGLDYTGTNCIAANTFSDPEPQAVAAAHVEEDEARDQEQAEKLVQQALDFTALTKRIDQVEASRRANARRARQQAAEELEYLQAVQTQLAEIDQEPEQ